MDTSNILDIHRFLVRETWYKKCFKIYVFDWDKYGNKLIRNFKKTFHENVNVNLMVENVIQIKME